ncbi:ATP-grasp domain-containing protein [Nocardia gipuzkoensis]
MTPTLIVCGVGSGMERSLSEITEMGYQLVVVTDRPNASVADTVRHTVTAYPRDAKAVVTQLQSLSLGDVAGVMSLGYENPPVISRLAELFNTPGLPVDTAVDCTDKARRIGLLNAAKIRVPRHRIATTAKAALDAYHAIGDPAVVKPADLTSSMGVALLDGKKAPALIARALQLSASGCVLIEEYLRGSEYTVEGVSLGGHIHITGISDRNYSDKLRFAPHFFENGDTLPSALPPADLEAMVEVCARGVAALALDPAVFSCDVLRTDTGEIVLLEVAARMSGSRFGTEIVPLSTGVNVLPSAVRLAVGDSLRTDELAPKHEARPVVLRYLASQGGTVTHLGELPPAPAGVYDLFWENRPVVGDILEPLRSGKDVLAGVIATAGTLAEAELLAEQALGGIPIVIE